MARKVLILEAKNIGGKNIPIKFNKKQRRNDKCSCGSKRKFKNCHGKSEREFMQNKITQANY